MILQGLKSPGEPSSWVLQASRGPQSAGNEQGRAGVVSEGLRKQHLTQSGSFQFEDV